MRKVKKPQTKIDACISGIIRIQNHSIGRNRFELAGYNAGMATRAQNQAKVIMGRKMLERFELTK